jgi:hypothetical protein
MISNDLLNFITDYFEKNKIYIDIDYNKLDYNTNLTTDLKIDDLDFDKFITEFVEKFNVDCTNYNAKKYFGLGIPIIDNNVKTIKKIIGDAKWLPLEKENRKPFTLEVLEKSLIEKKLI